MTPEERLLADFRGTGLTVGLHPMAHHRATLKRQGVRSAIELRARAWLTEYGPGFPGDPVTGVLGASAADQARFDNFANDAPCPALDPATGRCDVYAWRPMTCRVFGPPIRAAGPDGAEGLGHCGLCFIGATESQVAACEMPLPHALEAELLNELGPPAETIVAFALIR